MRPAVSIHTLVRSAKALVSERKTPSARNGRSSGSVTAWNRCRALFDSSRAYSNSSGGIELIPASSSTPMKELPRQILNSVTLRKAQAPPPRTPSTLYLSVPMKLEYAVVIGGFRVQNQPITLTLAGYAHGRKIARKTRVRPRNGLARRRAKPSPRASFATLVTTV